jgi:hypothetical protein
MPFGNNDDFVLNPHFLNGHAATAPPNGVYFDTRDVRGPTLTGPDVYKAWTGLFFPAKVLPSGQFHRLRVVNDPHQACFHMASEGASLFGWLAPPFYPERPFNQGAVGRIFVFAGSGGVGGIPAGPVCGGPPVFRPVRASRTGYGWMIEVDSGGTGKFDMAVMFIEGP